MRVQRLPQKSPPLRPIQIVELGPELTREELGDPVLKTFSAIVRERQMIRVRTYGQLRFRRDDRLIDEPLDSVCDERRAGVLRVPYAQASGSVDHPQAARVL